MKEIELLNFCILNLNSKRVLQNVIQVLSQNKDEVLLNIDDILKVENIKKGLIEVYKKEELFNDSFLKTYKIKEKDNYILSKYGYTTIEEYNKIIINQRKEAYETQIDTEIQSLQTQFSLKEISQKEYDEQIEALKQKKQEIKEKYKKI